MALYLDLEPHERIIIDKAWIRNGDKKSSIYLESQVKVLREKDIITESNADTICKKLYVLVQLWYLAGYSSDIESNFMIIANEIMAAAPSTKPFVFGIYEKLASGSWHLAIEAGQELIDYEKNLMNIHDKTRKKEI